MFANTTTIIQKSALLMALIVTFLLAGPASSSGFHDDTSFQTLQVVKEAHPRLLKGGKGGGSFGGGSFGGGSKGSYGSYGGSSRPVTTTYTTPGRIGYRPYYATTGSRYAQDYNCTDLYNVTTNITTTTCVYTGKGGLSTGAAIGIMVGMILVVGIVFWIAKRRNRGPPGKNRKAGSKSVTKQRGTQQLNEQLDKARTEIQGAYNMGYKMYPPQSGTYVYSYIQNGKVLKGKCHLFFSEKLEGGYAISGTSSDPDGVTKIDEGFCTNEGTAFWKETYVSGDAGLQVLQKGEFDFTTHSFQGQWWASSNETGSFDSFKLEGRDDATVSGSTSST